jgi:hypothetical protein
MSTARRPYNVAPLRMWVVTVVRRDGTTAFLAHDGQPAEVLTFARKFTERAMATAAAEKLQTQLPLGRSASVAQIA